MNLREKYGIPQNAVITIAGTVGVGKSTTITYWEEMHGRYENWINSFNACPVLRLVINDYDLIYKPEEVESIA